MELNPFYLEESITGLLHAIQTVGAHEDYLRREGRQEAADELGRFRLELVSQEHWLLVHFDRIKSLLNASYNVAICDASLDTVDEAWDNLVRGAYYGPVRQPKNNLVHVRRQSDVSTNG